MFEIERTTENPGNLPESEIHDEARSLPKTGALSHLDFFEPQSSFHSGPQWKSRGYALVAWSFAASVIDSLIVISFVSLFLFAGLAVGKSGQAEAVMIARPLLMRSAGLLFVFIYASYLLLSRIFLGSTLGEWACGLRLGEPRHRLSSKYSLFVIKRFLIVVGTGVLSLPVLSYLTGRDWAGMLSGLPLISITKGTKK